MNSQVYLGMVGRAENRKAIVAPNTRHVCPCDFLVLVLSIAVLVLVLVIDRSL
jgi:hypothetical protein